jgi:NAD+ diphosphatase
LFNVADTIGVGEVAMIPALDRSERHRVDTERLAAALMDPRSQFVLFDGDRALLRADAAEPVVISGDQLLDADLRTRSTVFLGLDGDTPWFALDVDERDLLACRETIASIDLTRGGGFVLLGPIDGPIASNTWEILSQARALLAWNRSTACCPTCGAPTNARRGGHQRVCNDPQCGKTYFPRTDPAVIVRVVNADRCLLARSQRFRPDVWSVLAGFVEPGESLEAAVRREVEEEVGLSVEDVRYLGSQPWPFPMSLMVAFEAYAPLDRIRIDAEELESADWFNRDGLRESVASGRLVLPSRKSIARRMIDRWIAGHRGL